MTTSTKSARSLKSALGILLYFSALVLHGNSQGKRVRPASSEPCPDEKIYTGRYRNIAFGFSIIIPAGLKGYWNSARCAPDEKYGCVCMGDHGRFIPLSTDAHIEVFVGYQMEPEWSVVDHEEDEISSLKRQKGVEQVRVVSSRWCRLGRLKGRRFVAKYIDKNRRMITDHIIALHRGIEYELTLHTLSDRYERDNIQFAKVIASWRLTPRRR
jgi:hypothetical protein